MNSRRLFLRGLLVGAAAPAIVKAESLMKIVVPKPIVYPWYTPAGLMTGEVGRIEDFRVVSERVVAIQRQLLSEWILDPERGQFFIRSPRGPGKPLIFHDESTFQALASTDRDPHRV